jgi:hypothetical protein
MKKALGLSALIFLLSLGAADARTLSGYHHRVTGAQAAQSQLRDRCSSYELSDDPCHTAGDFNYFAYQKYNDN